MRNFNRLTNVICSCRFLWETKFYMWNHRYNLIKFGPNIFKICPLVALHSGNTDIDLIFTMLSLMFLNFIKCAWSVMVSSQLISMIHTFFLYCVGSLWMASEFGILSMIEGIVKYSLSNKFKQVYFQKEVTQFHMWELLYHLRECI